MMIVGKKLGCKIAFPNSRSTRATNVRTSTTCGATGNALGQRKIWARFKYPLQSVLLQGRALGSSLSGLLDNVRAGIIHLDRQGRILEVNDRCRQADLVRLVLSLADASAYRG